MSPTEVRLPARYEARSVAGEGAMGCVVRALDTELGREVAIKVLRAEDADELQRARMLREARAAARLRHENIVEVYDVDTVHGLLVMEYLDGESARDICAREGRLSAPRVRRVADAILRGLAVAHAEGVVHRDVKPSNVMITRDERVVLVDFGIARLDDQSLTATGEQVGTPAYMSPEQLRGADVDPRTDLYSLGAMLYELLVGRRIGSVTGIGKEERRALRDASTDAGLRVLIERCLEPRREDRPASAALALRALHSPLARWRGLALPAGVSILAMIVAVAVAWGIVAARAPDPRYDEAFELAQRGQFEAAKAEIEALVADEPDHTDARVLHVLVAWWTASPQLHDAIELAQRAPISPEQRAMVRGIALMDAGRFPEAIAMLAAEARARPRSPEILYALGEATWHGDQLERGAQILRRCFEAEPRWRMALHHVVDFELARGRPGALEPIVARLEETDGAAAAELRMRIAMSRGAPERALAISRTALARWPDAAPIWLRTAEGHILLGEFDEAERVARDAIARWPVDDRERGGFALHEELLLYRGRLDELLRSVGSRDSRVAVIATAMWTPAHVRMPPVPTPGGVRASALLAAAYVLANHAAGNDMRTFFAEHPDPDVRALGHGLYAERRGELGEAVRRYREGLRAPTAGSLRMILAHRLATVQRARGDLRAAARSCREVIRPRLYQPYRAVLLPDCLSWSAESGDGDARAQLDALERAQASDGFAHPAFAERR